MCISITLLCSERQWWNKVLGSEDWQRDSSSVAAGTEEGCCLTPWCFVGGTVGEIRADKHCTGGSVLGLLLRLKGYSGADFDIFSALRSG